MSALTLTIIRFAFLILLWVFVALIVSALRRDLAIDGPRRVTGGSKRRASRDADGTPVRSAGSSSVGSGGSTGAAGAAGGPTAPPRVRPSRLVVVEGPQTGTVLELADSPVLLGRAQEATLVLADDYASGRHARLFPQGSRWFIEDLGSTNGTFVGSEPLIRAIPVEPGTPLRIGKTVFELRN